MKVEIKPRIQDQSSMWIDGSPISQSLPDIGEKRFSPKDLIAIRDAINKHLAKPDELPVTVTLMFPKPPDATHIAIHQNGTANVFNGPPAPVSKMGNNWYGMIVGQCRVTNWRELCIKLREVRE